MSFQTLNKNLSQQISNLENLRFNLAQMKMQYAGFVNFTATKLIEQEIIDLIHTRLAAAGISKKVIETTFLNKKVVSVGSKFQRAVFFFVTSNYISETGFPVAVMIEKGRKAFFVKPTKKQALSWLKDGQRFFSKGHEIPAYPARRIIYNTINEKRHTIQERLDAETVLWIRSILKL